MLLNLVVHLKLLSVDVEFELSRYPVNSYSFSPHFTLETCLVYSNSYIISLSRYVTRGVNHTTRPRSEGEIDGEQYHFVTYDTFKEMLRRGMFITTSENFGHLYGFGMFTYYITCIT